MYNLFVFFFNDTATTEIYTLSLHDALPICPISVAATNHVVYALNNVSHTLAGFRIGPDGGLTAVPSWTRALNPSAGNGAQVQFSRDGRFLVVVERGIASSALGAGFDVFPVNPDGSLGARVSSPSVGAAPFGFDIDRKSTRLNSSHANISYAVFCLKKKKNITMIIIL